MKNYFNYLTFSTLARNIIFKYSRYNPIVLLTSIYSYMTFCKIIVLVAKAWCSAGRQIRHIAS